MAGRVSDFTANATILTLKNNREQFIPGILREVDELDTGRQPAYWGQRKLAIDEIQFLTLYWDPVKVPNPVVVYAGAAPGIHIHFLRLLFPTIVWHLYDPSDQWAIFADNQLIFVHREYFTDTIAQEWANGSDKNRLFFISDIRSTDIGTIERDLLAKAGIELDRTDRPVGDRTVIENIFQQASSAERDALWADMESQARWVRLLKPIKALLKFKMPFIDNRVNQQKNYLKGTVFFRAWGPPRSTETSLVPDDPIEGVYPMGEWSTLEYEEWLTYHRNVVRRRNTYYNPMTKDLSAIDAPELLNDFDSNLEFFVFRSYLLSRRLEDPSLRGADVGPKTVLLSRMLTQVLNEHPAQVIGIDGTLVPIRAKAYRSLDGIRQTVRQVQAMPSIRWRETHNSLSETTKEMIRRKRDLTTIAPTIPSASSSTSTSSASLVAPSVNPVNVLAAARAAISAPAPVTVPRSQTRARGVPMLNRPKPTPSVAPVITNQLDLILE